MSTAHRSHSWFALVHSVKRISLSASRMRVKWSAKPSQKNWDSWNVGSSRIGVHVSPAFINSDLDESCCRYGRPPIEKGHDNAWRAVVRQQLDKEKNPGTRPGSENSRAVIATEHLLREGEAWKRSFSVRLTTPTQKYKVSDQRRPDFSSASSISGALQRRDTALGSL